MLPFQTTFALANEVLYVDQDVEHKSVREAHSDKTITRQDRFHHGQTFIRDQFPVKLTPYPTNVAIKRRSVLAGARDQGVHDLKGSDLVWASASISDVSQKRRHGYPGRGGLLVCFENLLTSFSWGLLQGHDLDDPYRQGSVR